MIVDGPCSVFGGWAACSAIGVVDKCDIILGYLLELFDNQQHVEETMLSATVLFCDQRNVSQC